MGGIMEKCCYLHEVEEIKQIKDKMPSEDDLSNLAEFFKMLGDSTRIKIICVLFEGEMCVSAIVDILDMSQSAVSHQLRILKRARVVKSRKEGKLVFYTLDDDHVKLVYEMGMEHIFER
jgi:ArsR family transcriptional regulator